MDEVSIDARVLGFLFLITLPDRRPLSGLSCPSKIHEAFV